MNRWVSTATHRDPTFRDVQARLYKQKMTSRDICEIRFPPRLTPRRPTDTTSSTPTLQEPVLEPVRYGSEDSEYPGFDRHR